MKKSNLLPIFTSKNGRPIEEAMSFVLQCRAILFNGKNNKREFNIITSQGEVYTQVLYYGKLEKKLFQLISARGWIQQTSRDLLQNIISNIDSFNFYIVNKKKNNKSFIMLAIEEI
jgi:pyruvate formate-lyase activating enzyme-like uncharacterized protein